MSVADVSLGGMEYNFSMHSGNDVHIQTVSKSQMCAPTCKQFPATSFG